MGGWAGGRAGERAGGQAGRQAGRRAGRQAGRQEGTQAGRQADKTKITYIFLIGPSMNIPWTMILVTKFLITTTIFVIFRSSEQYSDYSCIQKIRTQMIRIVRKWVL